MNDNLKRMFYIEMCKIEKWSSRQLQERINSMLYKHTAISKKNKNHNGVYVKIMDWVSGQAIRFVDMVSK